MKNGRSSSYDPGDLAGEEGKPGKKGSKPSFWRRLSVPWKVFLSLLSCFSAFIAIYGFLNQAAPPLSADELRLDDLRPQKLATNCHPYIPGGSEQLEELSTADLKCEPLGNGPETVKFHLFTNHFDLEEFMDLQREGLQAEGVGCTESGFPYTSPWVDFGQMVRGELICADYSDDSKLLWSYDNSLVVASAASAPEDVSALHQWWQREVKFGGHFPRSELQKHLYSLLPDSFRPCHQMPLLAPTAVAGLSCRPGQGIDNAGAELFTDEELLSAYLDGHADLRGIDSEGCRSSPFSYTSWGAAPDYEPALGYLLCRPENGVEWFEWTALEPLVYAYASREDSDRAKLFEQWALSLSEIHS
jgi:hypothetical protein